MMEQPATNRKYDLGMIGLGVMGRNLLLNMVDHGFSVAGHDKDLAKINSLKEHTEDLNLDATSNRRKFIGMLKVPRTILLLVPAGQVVDSVISELIPDLDKGDLIIDGGNSHFRDTERRIQQLKEKEILFMGTGISGGEEGARLGPSIMPGGSKDAWERVRPVFEAIAARVDDEPCVTWMGKGASGHYVKMVHNGIEYAIMQQISEAYDLMKRGLGLNNSELHSLFTEWNTGKLNSFLVEITAMIFGKKDDDGKHWLVDEILDTAGQKGTGMWTTESAMELQVPVPSIDMAVAIRDLSKYKNERSTISKLISYSPPTILPERDKMIDNIRDALYCSILLSYVQGFLLLEEASEHYKFGISLQSVARIWRGGCIIRAKILDEIRQIFSESESGNLLLDMRFAKEIRANQDGLRHTISFSADSGIPAPAMMAALGFLDAFRSQKLPTNLIQAQRDFFGSHTYKRVDAEGVFHTQWTE